MKLDRWKRPDCYFGESWPEYYVFLGQHRDSDILTQSNFQCALQQIGGESELSFIVHESHWAVGWVEWIAIHESDTDALHIAETILESLEDYPVVDEEHFSGMEYEHTQDVWNNCFSLKEKVELCQEFELSVFAARHDFIPQDDCGHLFDYLATS